jgi:hypothetical protein
MRALMIFCLLVAAPATAQADLALSLGGDRFPWPAAHLLGPDDDQGPSLHLIPQLSLDGGLAVMTQGAGRGTLTEGMAPGERQALAFVLGVIPGFGLGHVVAGSHDWPIWLVVDVVLFVVVGFGFWWGPWWHGAEAVGVLLFLVERGFEGYFAYRAAGGRPIARDALPENRALASLATVPERPSGLAIAF